MLKLIKDIIFAWRFKRAVRRANKMARLLGMKYMVILVDGKLKVVPKQNIRRMVAQHKFRKGITTADIERRALYVTI